MTVKEKMIQKICGASLIAASHFPIWWGNDGTIAMIFVPIGLYLMLTRKKWLVSINDFMMED